jgi:hypothetical protein
MFNAEIPQYVGKFDESILGLYKLLKITNDILLTLPDDKNIKQIWFERKYKILYSIVNIQLSRKVKSFIIKETIKIILKKGLFVY